MKRTIRQYGVTCILCLCVGSAAAQQPAPKPQEMPKPTVPNALQINKDLWIEPEWRLRNEGRDTSNFNATSPDDGRDDFGRFRLGVRWKPQDSFMLYLQAQQTYQADTGFAKSTGVANYVDFHQAYLNFHSKQTDWRLGRQEINLGDERLIGASNWANYARSFDAVRTTLRSTGATTDLFVGKLGLIANKSSDPTVAGAYTTLKQGKLASTDLYAIYKGLRLNPSSMQDAYTIGTRPKVQFAKRFDLTAEGAYQFGHYGARPIESFAFATNLGYTFPGTSKLRFMVERSFASGGNTAGTGTYRTFDQLYPSAHAKFGIMDNVGWRNMNDLRVGLSAKPSGRWNFGVDGHFFTLANGSDYWYASGGKPVNGKNGKALLDATGAAGRDLGTEFDFTLGYKASRNMTLSGGYGMFMPGKFVRVTNGGAADTSHWFFLQTSFAY